MEVGWEPTAEPVPFAELAPRVVPDATETPATDSESEETITDHYAALQAWTEWSKNQGRVPSERTPNPTGDREESPELAGHPNVWAEGQQGFAPYSQLFSRLKGAKDAL